MAEEIKLSEEAEKKLFERLEEQVQQGDDFRRGSNWNRLHEEYWRLHFAEPDTPTKDFPWKNASNLALPLALVADQAIVAHEYDAMFANDPVVQVNCVTDNADPAVAEELSQYYEWWYRKAMNLRLWGSDWLLDNVVDGTACAKVRQNTELVVRRREDIVEDVPDAVQRDDGLPPEPKYVSRETAWIERIDEVTVESADLSRIYMAPDTTTSLQWGDCPWYFQEQFLSWDDLVERRRAGYRHIDEDLRGHFKERELTEVEKLKRAKEETSESAIVPTLRVLEHYMRLPIPGRYELRFDEYESEMHEQTGSGDDDYAEEVIVTWCPAAQRIFRIVPLQRIYPDIAGKPTRPHVLNHYTRTPRYPYGSGVPSKMRHIARATNSLANQGINAGVLQNTPFFFFSPVAMGGEMPDILGVRPGQGVPTLDPRGVVFPRFNNDPQFWQSQVNFLQSMGERVGSVSDTQLGRNPSTPNAPRTARGMAMQVQQGNLTFGWLVSCHAQAFLQIFDRVHALKSRHAPSVTRYITKNRETGKMEQRRIGRKAFQIPVEFDIILNPNRQGESQTYMQLFQLLAAIPYVQRQERAVRALARQVYQSVGPPNKVRFDSIWPEPAPISLMSAPPPAVPGRPQPPAPPTVPPPGMGPGGPEQGLAAPPAGGMTP